MNYKKIKKLHSLIHCSHSILLAAPVNPDADSLGSVLAFYWGIKKNYPDKKILFYALKMPFYLNFLPGIKKIQKNQYNPKSLYGFSDNLNQSLAVKIDLIITFDAGDLKRIPLLANTTEQTTGFLKIVNIDHHKNGFPNHHLNIIKKEYSAAAQIVFDIFTDLKWKIDKDIATCLLAGIIYDTASFQHSSATPKTLETAAELMRQGANLYKISQNILNYKMPTVYLKAYGKLLKKAKKRKDGLIVSALSCREIKKIKIQEAEFGRIASLLSTVPKSKYSLILIEKKKGEIKGSLRTEKNRGIDVSEIAKTFGGGGHKLAAGFTINGRLIETKKGWKIIKKI